MFAFYAPGPAGIWSFLVVTLLLGGTAAFASGRAIALTWRPQWQLPVYMVLLAAAVRFVQWSVLDAKLLSLPSLLLDLAVLLAFAWSGYILMRLDQTRRQYGWRTESDP